MLSYLAKTAQNLASIFADKSDKIDKDILEELFIEADIDYDLIELMLSHLPKYPSRAQVQEQLAKLFALDSTAIPQAPLESTLPQITLVIGVNGAGKTTTIAKLAYHYLQQGQKVLLGAGDTFRAAAIEQLQLWASKLQVPIIASQQGSDPSALAYDTIQAGLARGVQHIIIDTAGRLHNQVNLQKELEKIDRTCAKAAPNANVRKILILDGTQGSQALAQARIFSQSVEIQGVIVTKLDGTSKGGVILSIAHYLQIPILYLGMGEKQGDLIPFDSDAYVQNLLDCFFISDT
ncbi:signal recognition particle-docking protein FtsY [Helicobacter canis]|uniref:Signal recognition particle-docking protein FtsY n=1 Tax=Helicobacter canis TaxID=29419 RepID=A0A5M9QSY1_9HELI|nr:signal recognition particle-docking protein FtsY [Helicobacter canis]KAA8711428.1 signal recognition particle-docking protein FtsY [Helicobacter canis]